jgi:DNA-dependent RNA polymerase auxiliary subunit epsilon
MDATDPTTGLLANIRERTRSWLRRREASVDPGAKVRDGLEGHLLHVENISDIRAEEYAISGSPLPEYGQNTHTLTVSRMSSSNVRHRLQTTYRHIPFLGSRHYTFPQVILSEIDLPATSSG